MASTIETQLQALMRQDFAEPWEVILAENGSNDRTIDIAKQFLAKLPMIIVDASRLPRSTAYARNLGASVASGEYLYFLDGDDEVDDSWLRAMSMALRIHGLVGCALEYEKLNKPNGYTPHAWNLQQTSLSDEYGFLPYCWGCGIGVQRDVHKKVGGFDVSFTKLQDVDYCWRIQLELGVTPYFARDAICHYRIPRSAYRAFLKGINCASNERLLYNRFHRYGLELGFVPGRFARDTVSCGMVLLRLIPTLNTRGDFRAWCNHLGYLCGWFRNGWRMLYSS